MGANVSNALADHPLRRGRLNIARADVVERGVPKHVLLPGFGRNVPPARSDHKREFRLVVRLARILRKHDRLPRADHHV